MKNYDAPLNLYIYEMVPNHASVLDVGCSSGALGKRLITEKGCTVDGVDVNDDNITSCINNGYFRAKCVDLNSGLLSSNFDLGDYDCIVLSDVIEHLLNPSALLEDLHKNMKQNSVIICSVPNVAFILNRIHLLFGNWDYKEYGILDNTHTKFFTFKSINDVFVKTGFNNVHTSGYNQFSTNPIVRILAKSPRLFAYQLLVVAKK